MKKEYEKMSQEIGWFGWGRIRNITLPVIERFESRIAGTKGAPEKRAAFAANMARTLQNAINCLAPKKATSFCHTQQESHKYRHQVWCREMGRRLAEQSGQLFDEHGGTRGDHMRTHIYDYVSPWEGSAGAPYHDMGEGLAIVNVTRTRVYAKSSKWRPSTNETTFLVGKNEAGTYFAHPVPRNISGVADACQWIWNGSADRIIARQGDIALIWGNGPKLPALPGGHRVEGDQIVHDTHPSIPLPSKGQRIIVGRRASVQVSAATRD